jgi:hypothetical protein
MSFVRNIFWWLLFTACAIVVQAFVPGLDALSVGVVLLLQEKDYRNLLWLLPFFIVLQEGMGTRPFSSVLLWYTAILLFFRLGRWLLNVRSFFFVMLLSIFMGASYFAVEWFMAPLQQLDFNFDRTMHKCLIQTLFLPCAWLVLLQTRPGDANVLEK